MYEVYCPQTYRLNKEYPLYIGKRVLDELPKKIAPFKPNKVLLITDSNLSKLYSSKILSLLNQFETHLVEIPAGEENKNFQNYLDLCNKIIDLGATKSTFLVIMGGGMVGNLAGFAASTVMRGLNFAHIPTNIMAQVDSTTGGKQAINLSQGKNLLGVFNDPKFILIDIDFLKTLPKREISCGLAECIKHAICQDENFVDKLYGLLDQGSKYSEEDYLFIIKNTIDLKIKLLRMDPKEINEGKILVYGHTIGHAVETLSKGKLNHGESISIGMVAAARASVMFNIADNSLLEQHIDLLQKAGLPTKIIPEITYENIINQLKYDKKISSTMDLILLEKVGVVHHIEGRIGYPVDKEQLKEIILQCY